ncbi:Pimeloyl-ACP methyl ester carboxylesterase [Halogeometricum rufum]|uniref:Pimeloyl-ACP methyl ester carboxylesterase n=1 Tax=Halogeometricum rufum TaxID=553469 RepID=A0A1I6GFS3_9EURY|nr:alpha/beta hydrolase [Halogeometricum rufum]SFR41055.1 Pimeloyl-ACP methyl ester carboxylesterase [Halogeometricum rufum]
MKLRNVVGGVVAGAGLLAATNAALSRRAPPLEPALSGDQRTYRWRGIDVRYAEAGDEDDPDLLLLHGINAAGSNGEFREVFDELAEDYHVVAPDLPGFGTSDRPQLRYSAALYEDFVGDFVSEFDDPAVVASSLTAAYLVGADPDVSRMILVCPTERGGPEPKQWLRELIRAPLVGEAVFNLLGSKPSIRYFNADHGYADPTRVSEEWTDYEWLTAHQQNARFAPASFISGYLNSEVDLETALADVDVPVTLVWGRDSDLVPLKRGRELAEAADCRLVVFDDAKLLPHVEFPEQFLETVREDVGVPA